MVAQMCRRIINRLDLNLMTFDLNVPALLAGIGSELRIDSSLLQMPLKNRLPDPSSVIVDVPAQRRPMTAPIKCSVPPDRCAMAATR